MHKNLLIRIFVIAIVLRVAMALVLNLGGFLFSGMSRDSIRYHITGLEIARQLASGSPVDLKSWIDDAWFLLIGYVYYLLPSHPIVIQLINALLGSLAAVMTAEMVWKAYGNAKCAFFAGWLLAVFPSFVYFNALMLKDAASLFLIATLGWAIVSLRVQFAFRYVVVILLCLVGYLGIREYFFLVGGALAMLALLPIFGRSAVTLKGLVLVMAGYAGLVAVLGAIVPDLFFTRTDYFDIDYINATRDRLNRGTGAIGDSNWGGDLLENIEAGLTGIYYFLFSIDPLGIDSNRQLFALPEMLIMLLAVPPLMRGMLMTWRHYRATAIVLIIFGIGVLSVYVSATTNAGALFRWRMQAFPFLFGILAMGLSLKRSRGNPLQVLMKAVTRGVQDPPPHPAGVAHVR